MSRMRLLRYLLTWGVPPRPLALPERLQVGGVEVWLKRSPRRRTLGLQVRGGTASALAPAGMPRATILAFLDSKKDWLARHVAEQQRQQPTSRPLQSGDSLPHLGQRLTLQLGAEKVWLDGPILHLPAENAGAHLKDWTRRAALPVYRQLVAHYAEKLGAGPKLRRVYVSDTRTRWGSCNAAGDIRLHWRLTRAPLDVLHYVALHEAAHLRELNHSPRYWALVEREMPGYAAQRKWLREQGQILMMDDGFAFG